MAATFRSVTNGAEGGPLTSFTKPAGCVSGDITYCVGVYETASPATVAGHTSIATVPLNNHTDYTLVVYRRVCDGSEGAGFAVTGTLLGGGCICVQGGDTSTPEDATPTTGGGNGSSYVAPSISAVTAACLLICCFHTWEADGSTELAQPAGMTRRVSQYTDFEPLMAATEDIAGTGATGTRSSSAYGTSDYCCISILVRPSGGGGGGSAIAAIQHSYRQRRAA